MATALLAAERKVGVDCAGGVANVEVVRDGSEDGNASYCDEQSEVAKYLAQKNKQQKYASLLKRWWVTARGVDELGDFRSQKNALQVPSQCQIK